MFVLSDLDLKDIKAMTIGNEGSTCNMEIRHDTGMNALQTGVMLLWANGIFLCS